MAVVLDRPTTTPLRPPPSPVPGGLVVRRDGWIPDELRAKLRAYSPKSHLGRIVKECFRYLPAELAGELLDRIVSCVVMESSLAVVVLRGATSDHGDPGTLEDWGVVRRKVITNNGVAHIVDAYQNLLEPENMNYHGLGTGTTAEAAGDTALVTELTTQYNPDNTRATGTQSEPASNQYRSVGTNTLDAAATIQEHGLFTQAATGGGVLFDRSLTGGQALSSGDGLQATHTTTYTAGG